MHIIFRFIILFIKCLMDIIGDIFYYFGLKLSPLTFENISKELTKEARSELLQVEYLQDNLDVFIRTIADGNTMPVTGRYFTKVWLIHLLELRVRIKRCLKEDPSIYRVPLKRPIFFVTMMRTGSTFMHCLMAEDDQWSCPKLWELEDFSPPPGTTAADDKTRIARCQLKWEITSTLMGWNDVKKAHGFNPLTPEDLLFLYHLDFKFITAMHDRMEGEFMDFFQNQPANLELIYNKNLKTHLQMICKNKDMENKRLLTMLHASPAHLESLLQVFPDAQIITLHRDPVGVMKSVCDLIHTNSRTCRRLFVDNKKGVGRRLLKSLTNDSKNLVKWRKDQNLEGKGIQRFIDVNFKDLIKNPIETVQSVYKQLGTTLDDNSYKKMAAFLNSHKKSSSKAFDIQDFGLTKETIRESFKEYTDYFKV
ncbi:DgyrCDS12839 [Dimorphilus gyrociliatus]|uniref:DgyrCDS12839 n=1 Tax=Dimorphilus gyrociliatus TaxID=2664684 RepID=A0A7I8W8W0_9ANNE|nr:DgyrCDS12839 [Dimorphilus gyrociliatus]